MLKATIFTGDPTKTDDYQLERRATELKRAGDMAGAIECLRQAQSIRGVLRSETRLAKYLQEAGRFDEAMQEIRQMIADSYVWSEGNFGHNPRSARRCQQASRLARLHDDAALLCKREGALDQQAHFKKEAEKWWQQHRQIKVLADRDRKKRRERQALLRQQRADCLSWVLETRTRMEAVMPGLGGQSIYAVDSDKTPVVAARQAYAVALLYLDAARPSAKAFYQSTAKLQLALAEPSAGVGLPELASSWRESCEVLEKCLTALSDDDLKGG